MGVKPYYVLETFNPFPVPGCALRLRVTFGLSAPSSAPRGGLAVTSYLVDPCSRSVCTSPSRGEGVRRSPAKHGPIPVRSGISTSRALWSRSRCHAMAHETRPAGYEPPNRCQKQC